MENNFEVIYGNKVHDSESDKQAGPWERVSEKALALIAEEKKQKALELINSPEFKNEVKGMWDRWTLDGRVNEDPAKQEEIWARDLANKIESRILM